MADGNTIMKRAPLAGRTAVVIGLVVLVVMGLRHNVFLTGATTALLILAIGLRLRIKHAKNRERARFKPWIFERPEIPNLRRLARRTRAALDPREGP